MSEKKSDKHDVNQLQTIDVDGDYGYKPNIQMKPVVSQTMDNTAPSATQKNRILKASSQSKMPPPKPPVEIPKQIVSKQTTRVEEYIIVADSPIKKDDLTNVTTQRTSIREADKVVDKKKRVKTKNNDYAAAPADTGSTKPKQSLDQNENTQSTQNEMK